MRLARAIGLLTVAVVAWLTDAQDATGACKALAKAYPEDVELPRTPDYIQLNTYYASNTAKTPYCIFTPRTSEAAAFSINVFREHKTVFAIRSGGHSMNAGFSSTSDGVVVNLSLLNGITLHEDTHTVKIGAGNTWEKVYRTLEMQRYTVAGGRYGSVGVGGLSLGGGIGFYIYDLGFSCDNIVAYEVVTAKGEVLTVTAKGEHKDLFLGLKGSGAPFVLVTAFTYKLIPLEDPNSLVWGGSIYMDERALPAMLDAFSDFMAPKGGIKDLNGHMYAVIAYLFVGNETKQTVIATNTLFWRKPLLAPPPSLKPFVDAANIAPIQAPLGSQTPLGNQSISNITDISDSGLGPRQFMVQWTAVDPTHEDVRAMEQIIRDEVASFSSEARDIVAILELQPLGDVGGRPNVLGLEKGKRYLSINYYFRWVSEQHDGIAEDVARKGQRRSVEYLKKQGRWAPWVYMNYASAWDEQDPIASYGKKNVEFLRAVQKKYDPECFWETQVKGGFKIPQKK